MIKVIIGAQWGDEGKGKIVDYLAEEADYIVRFQGGNNAGHTVVIGSNTFKLHHIPSGICRGKTCVIGNGVVVNPLALCEEIHKLQQMGMSVEQKLWISDRAHMIQAEHLELDLAQEAGRTEKVGTTGKGIGPAYSDKIRRSGIRMGEFSKRSDWSEAYQQALQQLQPLITDTTELLHQAASDGKNIILEGAEGTFLDIDHGTYPFVTSSNCTSGGACTGSGLPPTALNEVVGILKAYTTRVGNGPFPTEDMGPVGIHLQQKGVEVGTTTGRQRRCGWLDLFMANYARKINGISGWVLTKLDVLSGLPSLQVCTDYAYQGKVLSSYPARADVLAEVKPHYVSVEGWEADLGKYQNYADFPLAVKRYIELIEDITHVPVKIISCGPERNQTLVR